jgi:two-component system alkaline phosphatase synthesis response regulator PhoP
VARLLLVEDEDHIASGLKFNLELDGHQVTWLREGTAAAELLIEQRESFDLIILDLMLPGMSGLDLCHALRKLEDYTPVLMLTAKLYDKDKVQGLSAGADDYVTKPFNLEELLVRIEGLLRRRRWDQGQGGKRRPDQVLRFRNVVINYTTCDAKVGADEVRLTPIEMALMKALGDSEGRVLTREELLKEAWGTDAPLTTRTVDNFVLRLRKLFELDPANPTHILSVRGRGYKFMR